MITLIICCDLSSIDADYYLFFTRLTELSAVPSKNRHLFFLNGTPLTADSVLRDLSGFLHMKDSLFVGELAARAEASA